VRGGRKGQILLPYSRPNWLNLDLGPPTGFLESLEESKGLAARDMVLEEVKID